MYHCVVFAMNDQNANPNRLMADHFAIICTFIVKTCDKRHHPTVVPPSPFRTTSRIASTWSSMRLSSTDGAGTTRRL